VEADERQRSALWAWPFSALFPTRTVGARAKARLPQYLLSTWWASTLRSDTPRAKWPTRAAAN